MVSYAPLESNRSGGASRTCAQIGRRFRRVEQGGLDHAPGIRRRDNLNELPAIEGKLDAICLAGTQVEPARLIGREPRKIARRKQRARENEAECQPPHTRSDPKM